MSSRKSGALKRIEFLVLAVLDDGPRHGYGIAQEIEHRTQGAVSVRPGSLYRVLDRLVRMDFIQMPVEGLSESADRRLDYAITARGKAALVSEAMLLSSVVSGVLAEEASA